MAPSLTPGVSYIVERGRRLSGEIEPGGNKNAALPIIAAALLTDHKVTLTNVPRIRDVEALVELIRTVGAAANWTDFNTLEIEAKRVRPAALGPELCARIRASILLAGPLLAVRQGDAAPARRRRHWAAARGHAFPRAATDGRACDGRREL